VIVLSRRALVLGPPLVLGLLELGHPGVTPSTPIVATLAPITTWWIVLHVAQVPLFALLGLAAMRLVRDLDGRAARISARALAVFIVAYPAFDAAVGVGSGVMLSGLGPLSADGMAAIEPALRALFWGPVTGLMAIVAAGAWVIALVAAAWAWRAAGAPWVVVALLALSGLVLGFSHTRPFGPIACGALLVAGAWIESAGARWRSAPRPA
jgi:hypothetical protein